MMPEHSHRFFRNVDCQYFPCHKGADPERFNCLFCFCPLYWLDDCGGKPSFTSGVKDCTGCAVPHSKGGYDHVLARLRREFADRREATGDESENNPDDESKR